MSDDVKISRQRSPNFPAEPLEKCIEYASKLFEKYKRSAVAQVVAIKGLGFSPTSGGALQLLAALSAYGLLEATGSGAARSIKISDQAYKIIVDTRSYSPDRAALVREAALKPAIFTRINEDNPDGLPAEDALAHDLKLKYGFNPNSVNAFIRILTKTFEFAKVYDSDIIPDEINDYHRQEMVEERDHIMEKVFAPKEPRQSFIQLPVEAKQEIAKYLVGQGKTISLMADGRITQKAIKRLITKLEADVEDFPDDDTGIESADITTH